MADLNDKTPLALPYYQYVRVGGSALFNAKIYVGLPETDPTNPANQIDVLNIQAGGTTVVLDQPVRTDTQGHAVDDVGNVAYPVISEDYAIRVYDQNDALVYEESTVYVNPSESLVSKIETLSVTATDGLQLINVPDAPNSVQLVVDGDVFEQDVDYEYDKVTGNISLTTALTGNEQVFVNYGAIVSVSSAGLTGARTYSNIAAAQSDPDIEEGDSFFTNSWHNIFTGGGGQYVAVTTSSQLSQLDTIPLTASGLYAKLIPSNNEVTLSQAGAKFLDEGAAGFDDKALNEALTYCADNGVNLTLDGKQANFYETHQVKNSAGFGTIGFVISGAGNSTTLKNQDDIICLEFLDGYTYKNMVLKDFQVSSNGQRNDTGIKVRNWFESCSMQNVFVVATRYAFHILQSFNPSFYNCYARQAADRHAPLGGNDPSPSYGWWIDGAEGAINALYFFGCSSERFWHNRFIDNTADVGNFVSLEWFGGISQSAWQTGTMLSGGGSQCSFFGGYNENNWQQAQRINDGSGVLADQGINFTINGIDGFDDYSVAMEGVYFQVSQNIQNNAPIGEIMSVYGDSTVEELNFSSKNSRHGYNDATQIDWDFYFSDDITTLRADITLVNSGKASNESVYVGNRYGKKYLFSLFGLDDTTDLSTEPLSSFASDNGVVFLSFQSATNATFTTAPEYVIQNQSGAAIGTVVFQNPDAPLSVTAGEEYIARVNIGETGVFRFARSVTSVGDNPDFNVAIYQKFTNPDWLVTYEE